MHINRSFHPDGRTVTIYLLASRSEEELLRSSGLTTRIVYPRRDSNEPWLIQHLLDWKGADIRPIASEAITHVAEIVRRVCLGVADDLAVYARQ